MNSLRTVFLESGKFNRVSRELGFVDLAVAASGFPRCVIFKLLSICFLEALVAVSV